MTDPRATDYGSFSCAALSGPACERVRTCVTKTGDALGLDSTGKIILNQAGVLEGPQTNPPNPFKTLRDDIARNGMYGVYTASTSVAIRRGGTNWTGDSSEVRINPTTVEYQKGLALVRGKIVPPEEGQVWKVTAIVYIKATQACHVWGRLEGLKPLSSPDFCTGCVYMPSYNSDNWSNPLTIIQTGPSPDLEAQGTGFGSVALRCDTDGAATAIHLRVIVRRLGYRSTS